MADEKDVYTVEELAERLDVSLRTAYTMLAAGRPPSFRIGAGKRGDIRISKKVLADWMESESSQTAGR